MSQQNQPQGIVIRPVQNAGQRAVEILVYDRIGKGWDEDGVTAKRFAEDLKAAGKLDEIRVRINSPGGSVFEGLAIYNTLKNHPARVIVDIDGAALSIASVIALAGDEVRMADNALLMIHDPYGVALGTAEDMRKTADTLDRVKSSIVSVYANRTGKTAAEIAGLMTEETWFSAQEAKDAGFVDQVTQGAKLAAHVGEMWSERVPERFRDRLKSRHSNERPKPAAKPEENPMSTEKPTPAQGAVPTEPTPVAMELKSSAATVAELKTALPDSTAEFRESCIEVSMTLAQAKDAWMAELRKQVKARQAENDQLKAEQKKPGVEPLTSASPSASAEETGSAVERFESLVAEQMKTGKSKAQARAAVCRKNPELREAYVAEWNAQHKGR